MDDRLNLERMARAAAAGAAAALLAACGDGSDVVPAATSAAAPEALSTKAVAAAAVEPDPPPTLESLRGKTPPDPAGTEEGRGNVTLMNDYVTNRAAAVRLGKALFWDVTIGSDGRTACATCHFHAGADSRLKNQLNPGLPAVNPDKLFNKPAQAAAWGPNHALRLSDFPLHVLADPRERNSAIVSSTNDIVSSQGVFEYTFTQPGKKRFDDCELKRDEVFKIQGLSTRRVEPRNSPTVINAAFNVRNFWDGRANDVFNGVSPFGPRDPEAKIWVTSGASASAVSVRLALRDASAASQAAGPPGSDFEMSCGGRTFANIARRVLDSQALSRQQIAKDDSVLADAKGELKSTYRQMIQAAFAPRLWQSTHKVSLGGVPYSQMEANFSLFFGLAIQLYEATLVSDQAPLDAYLSGDKGALTPQQIRGMEIFAGKGKCINCHNGPELTNAATALRLSPKQRVERMFMGDNQVALYDSGFYNIGVRPTHEDLGVGGKDPWGNPLSFTRQYRLVLQGKGVPDRFEVDPCKFEVPLSKSSPCDPSIKPAPDFRDAVDGAFKVPTLRNIALTGPYFHNGGQATLEQVVAFYNRGGDRRGSDSSNSSGYQSNGSNLDPDIQPLGLTSAEQADLVAFLRDALTDPRVAWERAPFDHPRLELPHGHKGDSVRVSGPTDPRDPREAQDDPFRIEAVGRGGRPSKDGPLKPFHAGLK